MSEVNVCVLAFTYWNIFSKGSPIACLFLAEYNQRFPLKVYMNMYKRSTLLVLSAVFNASVFVVFYIIFHCDRYTQKLTVLTDLIKCHSVHVDKKSQVNLSLVWTSPPSGRATLEPGTFLKMAATMYAWIGAIVLWKW